MLNTQCFNIGVNIVIKPVMYAAKIGFGFGFFSCFEIQRSLRTKIFISLSRLCKQGEIVLADS